MLRLVRPVVSVFLVTGVSAWLLFWGTAFPPGPSLLAQTPMPTATLVPAPRPDLAGEVDSNSPAVWETLNGRLRLQVMTSIDGIPSRSTGSRLEAMGPAVPVEFHDHPGHGVWMEGVVADVDGTWYGFYHHEVPAEHCGRPDRMLPRIGAARSTDCGRTWEDLGTSLEAPANGESCLSANRYFVGGVGDLSVALDRESTYLYVFFSQYSQTRDTQGVGVARMPWADRDEPQGKLDVWVDGLWLPPQSELDGDGDAATIRWEYPAATPLVAPTHPWHGNDLVTDVFWGCRCTGTAISSDT